MVRVPDSKKKTNEAFDKMQKKIIQFTFSNREYVESFLKKTGNDSSSNAIDDITKFALNPKKYTIEVSPNFWLGTMLDVSRPICNIINSSDWTVLHFNKKFTLITSDNPVFLVPPENYNHFFGYGVGTKGVVTLVPISSNCCLVSKTKALNPSVEHIDLTDKSLSRNINYSIASNCDRYIYSAELRKLNKIVKDTHIDKYKKTARVVVN